MRTVFGQLRSELQRLPRLFCVRVAAVCIPFLVAYIALAPGAEFMFSNESLFLEKSVDQLMAIGAMPGFLRNVVDARDLVGSAIRTALFPTFLWIPIVVACSTGIIASDYVSRSLDVSVARGASRWGIHLTRWAACVLCCCLMYGVETSCSFAVSLAREGATLDAGGVIRFIGYLALNTLLLVAIMSEAMALYHVTGSSFITIVVMLLVLFDAIDAHLAVMQAGGMVPVDMYLSPSALMLNTCSMYFADISMPVIVACGLGVVAAAGLVTVVAVGVKGRLK